MPRKSKPYEDKTHAEDCDARFDKEEICTCQGSTLEEGPSPDEQARLDSLAEFESQFGGEGSHVRFYRFNRTESSWGYLDRFPSKGLDVLQTAKMFGAGKYRAVLVDNKNAYVGSREVLIELDPAQTNKPQVPVETDPLKHPAVAMVVSMLQAQAGQTLEILKAALAKPAPVETSKPLGVTDMVDLLSKLKTLNPPAEGTKGLKETLDLIVTARDLFGDNEKSEGVMGQISEAVSVAQRLGLTGPRPAPQTLPAPEAAPHIIMETPRPMPTPKSNPIQDKINEYIPMFVSWANAGKDTDDAAEFFLNEALDNIIPVIAENYRPGGVKLTEQVIASALVQYANEPAKIEEVFKYAPALKEKRAWVLEVIAKAVALATSPEPEGEAASEPRSN